MKEQEVKGMSISPSASAKGYPDNTTPIITCNTGQNSEVK